MFTIPDLIIRVLNGIDNNIYRARLYAGAGIIKGANPIKEKIETDIKLNALLTIFLDNG